MQKYHIIFLNEIKIYMNNKYYQRNKKSKMIIINIPKNNIQNGEKKITLRLKKMEKILVIL